VSKYRIKTVVALAHPADHPLAVREKAMAGELGYRWVHIPIVEHRVNGNKETISDQLEKAAAVLADPRNQPVYFHCHHGINRASMVQMAYRTRYCGWSLEAATAEIERSFGLIEVAHGPDYRHMQKFYQERVLPNRAAKVPPTTTAAHPVTTAAARF
jgi:protein-tyrosine phosphatase